MRLNAEISRLRPRWRSGFVRNETRDQVSVRWNVICADYSSVRPEERAVVSKLALDYGRTSDTEDSIVRRKR